MNKTMRFAAIGLLCVGASGLSFGETFVAVGSHDWDETYNSNTALFGAVMQQGGASLQSGLPTAAGVTGNAFSSSVEEAFTLTYDPSSGLASLAIGSDPDDLLDSISDVQTLTVAPAGGKLDHIGIALSTGSSNEAITIGNIVLNNVADTGNVLSSTGQGLFDFAMTPSADLSGAAFVLTGSINMSWSGSTPGSQLSGEIVGADATALPEPGTWALVGSALAGLGLLRRKRIV